MLKPAPRTRARAFYIWLMAPLLVLGGVFAVLTSIYTPVATAATSSTLNFQARLMGNAGTIVPDGTYNIDFKLYNADSTTGTVGTCSGACLWEETRKNSNTQGVQVINGYFSVNLGSVTSFPSTINWDQQLWLTMNIGGTSTGASPTWDGEMQNAGHSISLTALPYAFTAGSLASGSGTGRGTLSFASLGQATAITLPDPGAGTATVCYQNAAACGFLTGSAANYIQNGTSIQSNANFAIQSANLAYVGALIKGAASQTADILQVQNSAATVLFRVDPSGVVGSGDTNSASANTSDVVIRSGNAAGSTSNSGNVSIDAGTATGTVGSVNLGNANATTINIAANNLAHAIHIGDGGSSTDQVITIGSGTNTNSSVAIKGGTGASAVSLATGVNGSTAGGIVIGNTTGAVTQTISIGVNGTSGATTTLNIGRSTSGTANTNIGSINAGTVAIAGPTTVTGRSSGTATSLSVTNGSSGQVGLAVTGASGQTADVADFNANGVANPLFSLGSTGVSIFRNSSDSAASFQVQNNSGANLFATNTTDGFVINNGINELGNLIQNPSFEAAGSTDATGWYTPGAGQAITADSANAHGGNHELQISGNSSTHAVTTKYFAVHPGDVIYAEAYVKNSAGATGDGGIYVELTDKDKGASSFTLADSGLPGTSYTLKSITLTVPANKFFIRVSASVRATATAGTFYFDDFYLKRGNEQAPLLITNASTTAFQVQNASSQTVLGVDTTNSRIFTTISDSGTAVGFTFNTPSYTTAGAKLLSVQNNLVEKFSVDKDGNTSAAGNVSIGSGKQYQVNGTQISSADLSNNSDLAKLAGTGPQTFSGNNKFTGTVLVQNTNAAGFQVQNASTNIFTVDASGNKVILGTGGASGLTGAAQFNYNGSSGSISLVALDPSSTAYTLNLPAENGTICTSAASSTTTCSNFASASSISTSLAGKLNKNTADTSNVAVTAVQGDMYVFTNTSGGIASGVLKLDNGNNTNSVLHITGSTDYASGKAYILVNNTNAVPTGNLIDLQANGSSVFSVDASGNVATGGNISIASGKTYQINGVQISSAALSNDSSLAKLGSNQTFSGNNTFSSASNSFTGDGSGLTSLNATNVTSGTLSDNRLSSNVALRNADNSFTGANTFAPTGANVGTTIKQTAGSATSGSVLDVQTQDGTGHFLNITNAAANEGNVTLQSIGATRDLTLDSGSGTIKLGSNTTTLQKATTSFTIDLNNGSNSVLHLTNSALGTASLQVDEGGINIAAGSNYNIGGSQISSANLSNDSNLAKLNGTQTFTAANTFNSASNSFTGDGSNLTSLNATNITSGTLNDLRLSSNVPLKNAANTFSSTNLFKTTSSSAFQVQNGSSAVLFGVDTTNTAVSIGAPTVFTSNSYSSGTTSTITQSLIDSNSAITAAATAAGLTFTVPSPTFTSAGRLLYVSNNGSNAFIINYGSGSFSLSVNSTVTLIWNGSAWTSAGADAGTLQTGYNNSSGGTTPEIKLDSTRGGLNIQDADSTIGADLLQVNASNGGGGGLGATLFSIGNTGNALFKSTGTSTTAFQIQNSGGTALLAADTLNTLLKITDANLTINSSASTPTLSVAAGANTGGSLSGSASTTYYYKITAIVNGFESAASTESSINGASFTPISPPGAPTVATGANGGSLTANSAYSYKVTFVTADGESSGGTASGNVSTTSAIQTLNVTNIPIGPTGTTARKLYRTTGGGSTYLLVNTGTNLNNNSTTSFTDTTSDASLGAAVPVTNNARLDTNNVTVTFSSVTGATSYRIYRGTSSFGENAYQTASSSPFTDTGAAGTGGAFPSVAGNGRIGIGTTAPSASLHDAGTALFKNTSNSTDAFRVQDASGNNYLYVNTAGASVSVGDTGAASNIQIGNTTGAVAQTLNIGNNATTSSTSTIVIGSTVGTSPVTLQAGTTGVLVKTASSNTSFQVQNSGSTPLFTVNSSSTNVQIGSSSADSTAVLLVLDSYNGGSAPTEIDGAMYYDATANKFQCGQNGAWIDCGSLTITRTYELHDEFMSGASNGATAFSNTAPGNSGIGQLNWTNYVISTGVSYQYNTTGQTNEPAGSSDRPGILDMATTGGNPTGSTLALSTASLGLASGEIFKTALSPSWSTANNSGTARIGLHNETSTTTKPTTGAYWLDDPSTDSHWQYCYINGSAAEVCAASTVTLASATYTSFQIRIISSSEIDFYINGTKIAVTGITYNTTNRVSPAYTLINVGNPQAVHLYIDYFQLSGSTSTDR